MGRAYSDEFAWRVVMRFHWLFQDIPEICSNERGLGVSHHYVTDVLARYDETGDVKTHQRQGANLLAQRHLTRVEDLKIIMLLVQSPWATLKDQRAQFILETGVIISYASFCSAVHRLGYTRKKVRGTTVP